MEESKVIKVALCSLDIKWEDKENNKKAILSFIEEIKGNVDLIIFPEMTLTGFSMSSDNIAEILEYSETADFFKNVSKEIKTGIIFGMVINGNNQFYNSAIYVNNGIIEAIYRKIHPFSYAKEDKFYKAGRKLTTFEIKGISLSLTICYDLRFPEIFSLLSTKAKIIVNIANWPSNRKEHWDTLLKARAIENQVYLIGVNRTGIDGNSIVYEKTSKVVFADGSELLPDKSISDKVDIYSVDINKLNKYRNSFPTFKDKNFKLYHQLYKELVNAKR
jgi:predicted amidohydrolase